MPLPLANRREDRLTTVVMTGVTALTRATAWEMERSGVTRPARDIGAWLREADVTHISHEVAFSPDCPPPEPDLTAPIWSRRGSQCGSSTMATESPSSAATRPGRPGHGPPLSSPAPIRAGPIA